MPRPWRAAREPTACRARAPRGGSISRPLDFLGYFALVIFSNDYPPSGAGVGMAWGDGLIVTRVTADSDMDRAGVQLGDRLVAVNGRQPRNARDMRAINSSTSVGEELTWLFERSGRQFSVASAPHRRVRVLNFSVLPINVGLLASLIFAFVVIATRCRWSTARLLVEANRLLMPIDHVTGWLFRVARNRITDLYRSVPE